MPSALLSRKSILQKPKNFNKHSRLHHRFLRRASRLLYSRQIARVLRSAPPTQVTSVDVTNGT